MEIILSPENMTKLDNAVTECVNSLVRAAGEADFRKEVASSMKEQFEIANSDFNALVKERYDASVTEKVEKLQSIVEMNEALNTNRKNQKRLLLLGPQDQEENEDGA